MNVAQLLVERAHECGDAIAIVQQRRRGSTEISYRELNARSCVAAALLSARGVRAGDAVLVFHPPDADLYAVLIAIFRVGAVAVFVEPSGGTALLATACGMLPPAAFIGSVRAHALRIISPGLRAVRVQLSTRRIPLVATHIFGAVPRVSPGATDQLVLHRTDNDPALITFTSGSTGQPKAAIRTHGILLAQHEALHDVTASAGERDLVTLPIVVLANLAAGATSVLPDVDLRRPAEVDGGAVAAQMTEARATRFTTSPALADRVARHALATGSPLPRGLRVVTGGGPVFPDIVARIRHAAPGAVIVLVYGSTEAEPMAHISASDISAADSAAMENGAGLLTGVPVSGAEIRVLKDCSGTPLGRLNAGEFDELTLEAGQVGEIVVTGRHVVRRYLHGIGEEETKFHVGAELWHRTGDLGSFDSRGRLWLMGRASAAIRDSRGVLYPFAVECAARVLLQGVREVAVAALRGERILVVAPDANSELPSDAEIFRTLSWAALDRIVRVRRVPVDRRHNSKIDYAKLAVVLARDHPAAIADRGTRDAT